MTNITSFRDLLVWQKAMDLAVKTYRVAQRLPHGEQLTLGFQLRKSSLSIPSNIAEGWARHSTPTYINHLRTSKGSGAELETQVEVGSRVDLIEVRTADMLITDTQEVGRMLSGLVASLERLMPEESQRRRQRRRR